MRNEIARVDTLVPATYAADAWQRVIAARDAAKALAGVRIYTIDGVNAVKSATAALTGAIGDYRAVTAAGGIGGSVPATLSLTLGTPAAFGAFAPGVTNDYTATTTADVVSTAGDAALTVSDPSTTAPGHLTNGAYSLPSPLLAGGAPLPATVKTWSAPVSHDAATVAFSQHIDANDALRTGTYAKTLTFTLSTTNP
jgi:hypothetical protein